MFQSFLGKFEDDGSFPCEDSNKHLQGFARRILPHQVHFHHIIIISHFLVLHSPFLHFLISQNISSKGLVN